MVTGLPKSMSRPVPVLRPPKFAVLYQSLCQAVDELPSMA